MAPNLSTNTCTHNANSYNTEDDNSVSSEDAFLSLLGLTKDKEENDGLNGILVMDEEDCPLPATPIPLPPKCSRYGHNSAECAAVTIYNFCTAEECQSILRLAQTSAAGFQYITEASHVAPDGSTYKVQLQNPNPHKLAVLEDPSTIDWLWKRLVEQTRLKTAKWMTQFQARTHAGPPLGLNPRLRVLQYDASENDRFEPHFDATTRVGTHQTSRITVLLYLNEEFEGGETLYLESHISQYNNNNNNNNNKNTCSLQQSTTKVTPKTGKLVLFEHDLYHAGAPLIQGTKHVMRTDILFPTKKEETTTPNENSQPQENAKMKSTATSTNPPNDNKDTPSQPQNLVRDLCQSLHWSNHEQELLEEMGLLDDTLESFLVPGTNILQQILSESGIQPDKIEKFLNDAVELVQESNRSDNNIGGLE